MLLKIFHFLLNLAAVSLNSTNWFSFFICTPMFEYCHFLIYKAKERPSRGTWQCCWDLFAVRVLLSGEVLVVPSQMFWRKSWKNHSEFSCQEIWWSQFFSMSKIVCIMRFPSVVEGIKFLRFTSQHWHDLPGNVGVALQVLKLSWGTIRDPARCSVGTELRTEIPAWGLK